MDSNSSFFRDGTVYEALADADNLLASVTAKSDSAAASAADAATSATNAATSATNAAASAAGAATAVQAAAGIATPSTPGTAAVGTSTKWAHEDHVHAPASITQLTDSSWATWTPTLAMGTVGGTPITASVGSARYKQVGKIVHFVFDATISNVGVGNSGDFLFSLPVTGWSVSMIITGVGKEVTTTAKMVSCQGVDATHAGTRFYDATSLITGGNGTRVQLGGYYEAA